MEVNINGTGLDALNKEGKEKYSASWDKFGNECGD